LGLSQHGGDKTLEAFWDVVHAEDREEVKRRRQAVIADHRPYQIDYRVRLPNGTERTMNEQTDILYDEHGQAERILGTIQDITERKQAEVTLRRGIEAAEQAMRVKNTLIANMSHEIRTPINGILGHLQLLDELPQSEEAQNYIDQALQSTTQLLTLVNQLLDFSNVEGTDSRFKSLEFELRTALADILAPRSAEALRKELALTCLVHADVPTWVTGDPSGLRQILTHIVGNAIKFTEAGEIDIRVQLLQYAAPDVVLRFDIQDTGIGIAPEARAGLFQPFKRTAPPHVDTAARVWG